MDEDLKGSRGSNKDYMCGHADPALVQFPVGEDFFGQWTISVPIQGKMRNLGSY